MNKIIIIVLMTCLLLTAGCTTQSSGSGVQGTTAPLPVSVDPLVQEKSLPMDGHMVHTTSNTSFEVWVDSFETGEVQANGDQELTIYVAAKNIGEKPVQLVWFCKLTDLNGKTYGGIGLSHGGSGARSGWIGSNMTEMARDYVNIRSDRDLSTLSKGAVLDVYFMEKLSDDIPVTLVPEYHTSWIINPGTIH
jgi:hypothetical protein